MRQAIQISNPARLFMGLAINLSGLAIGISQYLI
jgi:hypothetical protein